MRILGVVDDMRIRNKFVLLLVVPIVAMMVFGATQAWDKYGTLTQMRKVQDLAGLNRELSGLVHELQKERGRTSLFLAAGGAQFSAELVAQRALTDDHLASLSSALGRFDAVSYGSGFVASRDAVVQRLAGLPASRKAADALNAAATGDYTATIDSLLSLDSALATVGTSADVARLVTASVALSYGKERTGQERATATNAFAHQVFDPVQFQLFVSQRAAQASYLGQFNGFASADEVAFYQTTVQGADVVAVAAMEQLALDRGPGVSLAPVDPVNWFDKMTAKIDLMKLVEDRLSADLTGVAGQLAAAAQTTLIVFAGMALVSLVVSIVLAVIIVRSILGPVRTLTSAAEGLAQGDLDQDLGPARLDELGQLATSFRRLIASQMEVAALANAMADGDLSRMVVPKSSKDVLGTAFEAMITNLRDLVGQVQRSAINLAQTSEQLGTAASQTGLAVQQVTMAVQNVASGAQDTSRSAQETHAAVAELTQVIDGIARGATDQARQVQTTSATAATMATGVEEVAANANQVATASQQTRVVAEHGGQAVRETTAAMAEIQTVVGQAAGKVRELGTLGQKIGAWSRPSTTLPSRRTCWH